MTSQRVNIVLDAERAVKLRRLAERTHTSPGTLARSLLSTALDDADPDPMTITDILDRIPGAWEDAKAGSEEIRTGKGIPPDGLWSYADAPRARPFGAAWAGLPLPRTCPPSHSWVAMGRVLTSRTAHSQRSIRVSAAALVLVMTSSRINRSWLRRPGPWHPGR